MIQRALFFPETNHRQRDGHVCAGEDGQVQVHLAGREIQQRVHYGNERAVALCLAQEGYQVDVGSFGVRAPDQDKFCMRVIFKRDAGHLSIHAGGNLCGRRGAKRARQARRSQFGKIEIVEKSVAQKTV